MRHTERVERRYRQIASGVAGFVGGVMLLVAVPAVWVDRILLDTERYTAILAPLIDDPAVQAGLAERMTDAAIGQAPALGRVRTLVQDQIGTAVARPEFATVWRAGVRTSHATALGAVSGDGSSLTLDRDTLAVEVGPMIAAATERLRIPGSNRISELPGMSASFVLIDSPVLGMIAASARVIDVWAVWLLVASIALLVGAVLLSPTRRRTLMWCAVGVAAAMAIIVAALAIIRAVYLDPGPDLPPGLATVVFDALTAPLRTTAWTILVITAVTALLTRVVRRPARVTGHG